MNRKKVIQKIFGGAVTFSLLTVGPMPWTMRAAATALPTTMQVADPEISYLVQRGDTLSAIARGYGLTVEALMAYNNLPSTAIYVGQRLLIPPNATPGNPNYPIRYVVQPGDTLSSIARRYDTTVAALMQVNGLSSTTIYGGQQLTISVATLPDAPMQPYIVVRGDTLALIARRYKVTVASIKASNGLTGDTIYVGQRLLIPTSLGYPTEPTTGATERIQFATGATSAVVSNFTSAIEPRRYLLRAQAGQQMKVTLAAQSVFLSITVLTPTGANLTSAGSTVKNWAGRLPVSGDYIVEVKNSGQGLADFKLTITIK